VNDVIPEFQREPNHDSNQFNYWDNYGPKYLQEFPNALVHFHGAAQPDIFVFQMPEAEAD
jgi:hypothetical protein